MTNEELRLNPLMHRSDVVYYFERVIQDLKDLEEQRFCAQEASTRAAIASAQLAVDKAEQTNHEWKVGHNEWKAAAQEKDRLYATNKSLEKVEEKVDKLESLRDIAAGKASQASMLLAQIGSLIGIVLGLIALFGGK